MCVHMCVYVYVCVCVCTRGKVRGQLSGIWPLFTPGEWNSFVGRWPYPRAWIVLSSAFWILPLGRLVCKIGIWAMRMSSSFSDQASNLWNALIGGISGWQRGSCISKGIKKIKDKRQKLEVVAVSIMPKPSIPVLKSISQLHIPELISESYRIFIYSSMTLKSSLFGIPICFI